MLLQADPVVVAVEPGSAEQIATARPVLVERAGGWHLARCAGAPDAAAGMGERDCARRAERHDDCEGAEPGEGDAARSTRHRRALRSEAPQQSAVSGIWTLKVSSLICSPEIALPLRSTLMHCTTGKRPSDDFHATRVSATVVVSEYALCDW